MIGTKPMGQRETGCYRARMYIWERKADRNVRISIGNEPLLRGSRTFPCPKWLVAKISVGKERNETIPDRTLPSLPMYALLPLTLTSKKSHIKWYRPAGRPPSSVKIERWFVGVSRQMDRSVGCTPVCLVLRLSTTMCRHTKVGRGNGSSRGDVTPSVQCLQLFLAALFPTRWQTMLTAVGFLRPLELSCGFTCSCALPDFLACDVHTKRSGF